MTIRFFTTPLIGLLADSGDGSIGHMNGWGGGWMWLWGSLMMLAWVAILGGATWLAFRSRSVGPTMRGGARAILDERYAKGELETDEYRERVAQLNGN